jgi:hypothetical protein
MIFWQIQRMQSIAALTQPLEENPRLSLLPAEPVSVLGGQNQYHVQLNPYHFQLNVSFSAESVSFSAERIIFS